LMTAQEVNNLKRRVTVIRNIDEVLAKKRLAGAGKIDDIARVGKARFTSAIDDHITKLDPSVPRANGIGGAHNLNEFIKNNVKIVSETPHPTMEGIKKIEYQIPSLDPKTGAANGWKARIYEKTVYDPAKISDVDYLRFGKEAANEAASKGVLGREWTGFDSNGVEWRGYTNANGEVTSFFPND